MGPQSMVSSCDTKTGCKVVGNGPQSGLQIQRSPDGLNTAIEWYANNEGDVEPVDVLVPVRLGDWCFSDVHLLRIVLGVSVWF